MPCCVCSESSGGAVEAVEADQDEEDVFQPSKGNVAFGSASDGWAFRLDQFADMYSAKLGAKPAALVQVSTLGPFCSMGSVGCLAMESAVCACRVSICNLCFCMPWLWKQVFQQSDDKLNLCVCICVCLVV